MLYAFTENFLLPLSHDEVTHGKRSLLYKMPGDEWQRFANLRLLYTYMFTHPGKKLLFMGAELAQGEEWSATETLDWYVLDYPLHQGIRELVRSLNQLYVEESPLHALDFDGEGFEWIDCHDAQHSVLVYQRRGREDGEHVVIALNFTPVPREGYRVGVPGEGPYLELLSSDAEVYGGSGVGNGQGPLVTEPVHWMNRPQSVVVTLPPLGGIVLKPVPARALATPAAAPVAPESEDSEGPDRGPGADDATSVNS
jgi:1,4-alpha-glucan branching enzyme